MRLCIVKSVFVNFTIHFLELPHAIVFHHEKTEFLGVLSCTMYFTVLNS